MFKDYYACRAWLESFIPHTWTKKELGLERIKYLLKLLGNPQNKFKSIHVAGTSGKGSTAFCIAKLLQESGKSEILNPKSETNSNFQNTNHKTFSNFDIRASNFPMKVGLHISPHLVDIRERMQIFQKESKSQRVKESERSLMPMSRFLELMNEMKRVVERIVKSKPEFTPSYFEILVAASFLYFAQEKVDWVVVEVGLGGRLDATNVLNPVLTIITNVGLDHTEILGTKVEKIAYEKAGIIKRVREPESHRDKEKKGGVPVITGTRGKALEIIQKVAEGKKAPLIKVDTQLGVKPLKSDTFSRFNLPIDTFRYNRYDFVFSNKLIALSAVKTLGFSLNKKQVVQAFNSTFQGRVEEIERGVILDGAHNVDKIKFLINQLNTKYQILNTKYVIVIAFKKGKDWQKMLDLLISQLPVKEVIATKFHAVTDMGKHQAVEPKEIVDYVNTKYKILDTKYFDNSHQAVFQALSTVNSQQSTVLITGSLYLVGEARIIWKLPGF